MPENDTNPHPSPPIGTPEPLVSIESQSEFDLLTGERQERLFLKLYVAARTSGLLAAISDRDWKTLCVLATYMDTTGFCFPSQATLAGAMGCSRQMVSERVNSLARFRFQGRPVFVIDGEKHATKGRFAHNGYRVLPLASLGIFDGDGESGTTAKRKQGTPSPTVSRKPDTVEATVSSATGTVRLDTNKNQNLVNENSLSSIRRSTRSIHRNVDNSVSHPVAPSPSASPSTPQMGVAADPAAPIPTMGALADNGSTLRITDTESVAAVLHRGRGRPRAPVDPDREPIRAFVEDFAREFNDQASLAASTSRAVNLYRTAGIPLEAFLGRLYEARSIVKERSGAIRKQADDGGWAVKNKMPYFFSVVEDLVGLRPEQGRATSRGD